MARVDDMSAVNEIPARISQRLSPEQLCYATCAGSIDVHEHKCTYCRDELDADAKTAGDQLQIRGLTFFRATSSACEYAQREHQFQSSSSETGEKVLVVFDSFGSETRAASL